MTKRLIAAAFAISGAVAAFFVRGFATGDARLAFAAGGTVLVLCVVVFTLFWLKNRFSPLIRDDHRGRGGDGSLTPNA